MPITGVFLFLGFAVLVVALVVWGQRMAEARQAELKALGDRRGWRFSPDEDDSFAERHDCFALFDAGRRRRTYNTLTGHHPTQIGRLEIQLGDHRYTTGSGKNQRTHRLSYVLAQLPLQLAPELRLLIRPEHFGDKLGALLGFEDINFESEEFSRRYFVKSNHRKFAYDVIHPRMMEFLLSAPCGHLELCGHQIVVHASAETVWTAAELEQAVAWTTQFLELWPEFLLNELRVPAR